MGRSNRSFLFLEELNFDRRQYETCLRRIRYDDRDSVMYENMLHFLWGYVIKPGCLLDQRGLYEEYTHWNQCLIEKCFYHLPHDLPYANIRRAYQSVIYLLSQDYEKGMEEIARMGKTSFSYDGRAPKILLTQQGKRYEPVSKLFILYNYEKAFVKNHREKEKEKLCKSYPYAFTFFGDREHKEHDAFYRQQLLEYKDVLFYPVYERVYKLPMGPTDFYLYFDKNKYITLPTEYDAGKRPVPSI